MRYGIRSEPLHSYLFCFLASKYQAHTTDINVPAAAKEMYKTAIIGQGDKRIPGQSKEDKERNRALIVAANPLIAFTTVATESGTLEFKWTGDNGYAVTQSASITVV